MIRYWIKRKLCFVISVFSMLKLAWQTQPTVSIGLCLLTMFQGVIPLVTAWLTKLLFDLLAQQLNRDLHIENFGRNLLLILAAQAIVMIVNQTIGPGSAYLNAELGRGLTVQIQSRVYTKINSFVGLAYFENPEFHTALQLSQQGAQRGPAQIVGTLTTLLRGAITLIGFAGILITFSPLLAGLIGLAALPHLYTQLKISQERFSLAIEITPSERRASYYCFVLSGVQNAKENLLFGLSNHFLNKLLKILQTIHSTQRSQELHELRLRLFLEIISTLVFSTTFMVVVLQAFTGRFSLGDLTLYTHAVRNVQSALSSIVSSLSSLHEHVLFFSHFQRLNTMPQPVLITHQPHPVPELTSGIELRNISFRYNEEQPWILRNLNLHIPKGKCLALVGLNGTGKTTLVKLLTRLYDPTEGQILWDGIDIREFDPTQFRKCIGMVFQDFMRYDLSVQENIGLGDIDRVDELEGIIRAARKANAHLMIESLPERYQTILGYWFVEEGLGINLSSGQWQKIALARMFMRDAVFYILDEPTASLDVQAEFEVYSRFVELIDGRTSLLISHRFSTVRMSDIVAVLEKGQITEYGTHEKLVCQGGTYSKLYNRQAERYY